MLRFRVARRKERRKMKHLGSDQCKDAKRSQNSSRILHQQGSASLSEAWVEINCVYYKGLSNPGEGLHCMYVRLRIGMYEG